MEIAQVFAQLTDPRRAQGQRYPFEALLWLLFSAIASGQSGYRQIARFGRAHAAFFTTYFALPHGLPSHVSIRALLMALDTPAVLAAVNAVLPPPQAGDWVAGDGQALRATLEQAHGPGQRYCALVSLYCQRTGLTRAVQDYTSHKTHEGHVLRTLLAGLRAPQGGGLVVTLDALHCQKNGPRPDRPGP